jgi:hypothetical protein
MVVGLRAKDALKGCEGWKPVVDLVRHALLPWGGGKVGGSGRSTRDAWKGNASGLTTDLGKCRR